MNMRAITIASGKGGVGKSLAFDEYVSLADGQIIQIGPFIDDLIETNSAAVKKIIVKTVEGKEESFEVIETPADLVLDSFVFEAASQKLCHTEKKPVCLMRKPAPNELLEVFSSSGSISVTPEHEFIVMRNGQLRKVRADQMVPKTDFLLVFGKERNVTASNGVPKNIAQWLGFVMGDGYMEDYKVHVFCAPGSFLPLVRSSFVSVFGKYSELVNRNLHRISFFRQAQVKALYEKYGVKVSTAAGKEVPLAIFYSDNESVAAFISALFDTDGTVSNREREIQFDSKSKRLVLQVASLLRTRFGVFSDVRETFKRATNGKKTEKASYWQLSIRGKNCCRFAEKIGFGHPDKQNRLKNRILDGKPFNTNVDVFPVGKIVKKIRTDAKLTAVELGKRLGCSKQMVYEYEWEYYALSRETIRRYLDVYESLGIVHASIFWLETLISGPMGFRRVESVERKQYDWPYVYDFQVSELGGHFVLASGIVVSNTTITANLGIALAQMGYSVCLVDADIAMANLSLLLGMQSSPITLQDVLLGEASVEDALYDGPAGVKFIPSGLSLESYRRVDSERLESVIRSIKSRFDFVLLDAPAGIEKNVLAALSASEEVLLVTMPESPSIADAVKTKTMSERLGVKPIGVVINFVYGQKGEIQSQDIQKVLELPSFGVIPFDPEVRKSFMQEKVSPVVLRVPNSPASKAIKGVAARLVGTKIVEETKKTGGLSGFFNSLLSLFRRK